jgi:hypothetical protein
MVHINQHAPASINSFVCPIYLRNIAGYYGAYELTHSCVSGLVQNVFEYLD